MAGNIVVQTWQEDDKKENTDFAENIMTLPFDRDVF